ncbi:MAG: M23 family metallopeptidase [Ignavibacteriales bacterium]|nr:M23 family metallopeptidase [Ignavibacteriales bacterium]MCB9258161.1 M23 family metallopeptidase [Ignavibacteriales bacterium]
MKIFLLALLFSNLMFSQSVNFKGKFAQGNLIFGKADNVKEIMLDSLNIDFDKKGNFVFGFDRDDTSTHLLQIKLENKTIVRKIKPETTEYNIQRINRMEQKYVTPPKTELDRIAKEREISKKAREKIGDEKTSLFTSGFVKPINHGRISGVFGSQRILNGVPKNAHNGLDIAVPRGTPVKAMTDGVVRLSADNFYYSGNYILLDHGHGLNSFYLHLSKSLVKEGQKVKKGEIIGEVGTTGRSTGPHLHWGVQWFNKRVDPNSVFIFNN